MTKNITVTGLCVAFLCVLSTISFTVGEVPYSLGLLGVFLIGGLLSPAYAGLACFCYLLLGMVGVPVFSRFTAGIGILFGPTGGFLMAYPFMAIIIAGVRKCIKKRSVSALCLGMVPALLLGYIAGTVWFDVIKIVVAVVMIHAITRRVPIWQQD